MELLPSIVSEIRSAFENIVHDDSKSEEAKAAAMRSAAQAVIEQRVTEGLAEIRLRKQSATKIVEKAGVAPAA